MSPGAPETVFARITPVATYYGELSYGKMKPVFSPLLQPLRMPRPSTSYSPSSRQYFLGASAAAVQLGWDFTKSDSIVIMTSSTATLAHASHEWASDVRLTRRGDHGAGARQCCMEP